MFPKEKEIWFYKSYKVDNFLRLICQIIKVS